MQHGKLSRHFIYFIAWRSERGMGLVSTYVWRRSWPEFHDNLFISLAGEERFSWWRSREQRDFLILGKICVWLLWERWSSTGHKDHFPRRGLFQAWQCDEGAATPGALTHASWQPLKMLPWWDLRGHMMKHENPIWLKNWASIGPRDWNKYLFIVTEWCSDVSE